MLAATGQLTYNSNLIDLAHFPKGPINSDRVLGWAVYRFEPWYFFGFYMSEPEALSARERAGNDYVVAYGSNRLTGDDFIEGSSEVCG